MMEYTIRPMELDDVRSYGEMRRMEGVFENLYALPSEPLSSHEEWYRGLGPQQHVFVACDDTGRIIGLSALDEKTGRGRHTGVVGILVHRDCQGKGLDRALFGKLIDLADNWLLLHRLELAVLADNHRAISLYESFGFEKETLKKRAVIRRGQYVDEWEMGRLRKG